MLRRDERDWARQGKTHFHVAAGNNNSWATCFLLPPWKEKNLHDLAHGINNMPRTSFALMCEWFAERGPFRLGGRISQHSREQALYLRPSRRWSRCPIQHVSDSLLKNGDKTRIKRPGSQQLGQYCTFTQNWLIKKKAIRRLPEFLNLLSVGEETVWIASFASLLWLLLHSAGFAKMLFCKICYFRWQELIYSAEDNFVWEVRLTGKRSWTFFVLLKHQWRSGAEVFLPFSVECAFIPRSLCHLLRGKGGGVGRTRWFLLKSAQSAEYTECVFCRHWSGAKIPLQVYAF